MRGADVPGDDHWPRHARQWALIGPPLRPVPADVAALCAGVLSIDPENVTAKAYASPSTARRN